MKTYDLEDTGRGGYEPHYQLVESVDHKRQPDGLGDWVRREEAQERIATLEAALREIADFAEQFIGDDEDGDERMYKVHQIADSAIPFAVETSVYCAPCEDGECAVHPSTSDRGEKP